MEFKKNPALSEEALDAVSGGGRLQAPPEGLPSGQPAGLGQSTAIECPERPTGMHVRENYSRFEDICRYCRKTLSKRVSS